MKQLEGRFKQQVVKDLRKTFGEHVYVLVTQERGRKGVPDLIICLWGDSIRTELKINGKVPTPLQQRNLDRHTRAGGMSFHSTPALWPGQLMTLKEKYAKKGV